jgi:hypothetical protein
MELHLPDSCLQTVTEYGNIGAFRLHYCFHRLKTVESGRCGSFLSYLATFLLHIVKNTREKLIELLMLQCFHYSFRSMPSLKQF